MNSMTYCYLSKNLVKGFEKKYLKKNSSYTKKKFKLRYKKTFMYFNQVFARKPRDKVGNNKHFCIVINKSQLFSDLIKTVYDIIIYI